MDIGVARLVGHLINTVASYRNGLRAKEVAERMGLDRFGVLIEDPIDLSTGQLIPHPADEKIGAAGIRPFLQILPYRVDHLVSDENDAGFPFLPCRTVISLAVSDTSSG